MANRNDAFSKAGNRNDRFQQMSKQQQLIEEKKRLILNKLQVKKRLNEEAAKISSESGENPSSITEVKPSTTNIFSNDGSFFDQFQKFSEQSKPQTDSSQGMRESCGLPYQATNIGQTYWQDGLSLPMHPVPLPSLPPPIPPQNIPSPLPLIPQSIPPPRPLDITNIPPPHPLALHRIPPPPAPPCFQPPPFFNLLPPPPPPPLPQTPQSTLTMAVPADNDRFHPANPISYPPVAKPAENVPDQTKSPTKEDDIKTPVSEELYEPDIESEAKDDSKEDHDDHSPSPELKEEKPDPALFADVKQEPEGVKKEIEEEVKSEAIEEIKQEPSDWHEELSNDDYSNEKKANYEDEVKMESDEIIKEETYSSQQFDLEKAANRDRKRKSRWGEKAHDIPLPVVATPEIAPLKVSSTVPKINVTGMSGHLLTKVTRTEPGLLQYALQAYGSTNLTEEDWKKAEDNYKVHLLYQDMLSKRAEIQRLHEKGKFKYEYDSDEETEGGTWEHKCREKEMVATRMWAESLTEMAKGKHHIGDFLPPDELKRFMDKYSALKGGGEPDLSDYKEYKLTEENKGFQMLQKLGWTEGQGLGSDGGGIVEPINKAKIRDNNQGLGVSNPGDVDEDDDEYAAYRKRMMLAYRFRPNPLNNPRRPYY